MRPGRKDGRNKSILVVA